MMNGEGGRPSLGARSILNIDLERMIERVRWVFQSGLHGGIDLRFVPAWLEIN